MFGLPLHRPAMFDCGPTSVVNLISDTARRTFLITISRDPANHVVYTPHETEIASSEVAAYYLHFDVELHTLVAL